MRDELNKFLVPSWHDKSSINGGSMGDRVQRRGNIGGKKNNCKKYCHNPGE